MKKLLAFFLVICIVLTLFGCTKDEPAAATRPSQTEQTTIPTEPSTEPSPEPEASQITPLLYRVTDEAGNTLWLFGSIHMGYENFYPLPAYVTNAYDQSDVLAVEADIYTFQKDLAAQMKALRPLVYADGSKISDHLPEELYTSAVEIMQDLRLYSKPMESYCPALWSSLISNMTTSKTELDTELGIDMHFLELAHGEGKTVEEVESAAFQYQMLGDFSEELQIYMLSSSIYEYENPEESVQSLEMLAQAWADGDEALLSEMLAKETDITDPDEAALYEEYYDAMYTSRNLGMAQFAEEALASGDEVFLCVGAAHIVGEGALADLLAQRGYTVQLVGE